MKKLYSFIAALVAGSALAAASVEIPVMEAVSFYDGYLVDNIPEDAPDQGYLRLYTYLNSKRLTDDQLDRLGERLNLEVVIFAKCDNYDRIGSVNLAFVPKGSDGYSVNYDDTDPMRIEIARFITPFMNKNKKPKEVPYSFQIDNLSAVLRSASLREAYDIWLELEVFGVPYAAQSQIIGCRDCNHVFDGSVSLITDDTPAAANTTGVFVPIVTRRSDWRSDRGMNNYDEACTDQLGSTVKTYDFCLPEDVAGGRVVIMMSNHGAGTNGEEYERRMHYASLDGAPALVWKPGRPTCEPYREYNTQTNGIYGRKEQTDEWWQSFSNWCPGAPIPYQTFTTGSLQAGTHSVKIEVPDAVFYGKDGYFPVSMYFQGDTLTPDISAPADSDSPTGLEDICADDYTAHTFVDNGILRVSCGNGLSAVDIFHTDGWHVDTVESPHTATELDINVCNLPRGVYIVVIHTDRRTEARKVAL